MFRRSIAAALALSALAIGGPIVTPTSRAAVLPAMPPKVGKPIRRRTKRKPNVNRFVTRGIFRRRNKLARRLSRKVALGQNGAF